MSWLAVKAFFKKAWGFIRDQWLFFLAGIGIVVGFILGSRGGDMGEEFAKSKEESDRARAEKDARQRELLDTFQARLATINKEIEERSGEIDEEREKEIKDVVEQLREEMSDEELRAFLKEKAPTFNYIPPSAFGEINND